jgi:hypothetical protein
MPDGRTAAGAEVRLDYEVGWNYDPAKFRTGADGTVSIPHRYVEAPGWQWLWASHPAGHCPGRLGGRPCRQPSVEHPA